MNQYQRILVTSCLGVAAISLPGPLRGQNLLVDGDFEAFSDVPGWSLVETVTGLPDANVSSAVQRGFANHPTSMTGEFGLWLQSFNGNVNQFEGQNQKINAVLSQVVDVTPGQTYNWKGWSRFEPNFSGGVDTLDSLSPSGAVAPPTETMWELAFLDAGGAVVGAPTTLDIKADRTAQSGLPFLNDWVQHSLSGLAPVGAAQVRLTAAALDMVSNVEPNQSAFFDNFNLSTASAPAVELLLNPNLNGRPEEFVNWDVVEGPGSADTARLGNEFANDPATGGSIGFWMRPFSGADATVSQTVPGDEFGEYTFTASSAWEQNYTGGMTGTSTETFMELAFLDDMGAEITATRLDLLAAGQTNAMGPNPILQEPEAWRQFTIEGTAPEGTTEVRVTVGALGMVGNTQNTANQSAFFDDLILTVELDGLAGDYNEDGVVDAIDYAVWRENLGAAEGTLPNDTDGGVIGSAQFDTWLANYGASSSAAGSAVPTPEPGAMCLIALGFAGLGLRWRQVHFSRQD